MKAPIIAALGALLLAPALDAQEFSTLEEQMSAEEYSKSGLDKLSPAELRFLNQWLERRDVAVDRPAPAPAAAAAGEAPTDAQMGLREAPERVVIESRIVGEFNGWSGRTRFKLENGQVWQQVGAGSYYGRADSPAVRIEPKSFGSWKLYVEGIGRGVKVKRVK